MVTTNTVTLEIDGPLATIDPPRAELVAGLLAYDESVCQAGGPLGYRLERRRGALCCHDSTGRLVVMAGGVPRLVGALTARGRHVVVKNVTAQDERLRPDRNLLAGANGEDQAYLDSVTGNHRGQVVYHAAGQLGHLLALTRRAYPRARTLIIARDRQQVRSLWRQLRQRLRGEVSASAGRSFDPCARVPVITTQQFRPAMGDPDCFGLVLLVDADRVVRASVSEEALSLIGHRRVYGFVRPGLRMCERDRLELEGVCGPVVYEGPGPEGRRARVQVVLAEFPWTPAPSADNALEYKRRAVWHNQPRNEAVANLASALAAGRDGDLRQQGLLRPDVRLPTPSVTGRRVVILVESTEHGRELARLLPDWRLFTASTATAGERPPASGLPARSILTLVATSALGQVPADVLIRAGGGEGPVPLRGFPLSSSAGWCEMVVCDLADDGDTSAEEATRSRLRAYARLGWEISAPPRRLRIAEAIGRQLPTRRRRG